MKKLLFILAFCLTMPSPHLVARQHGMHVEVLSDSITIGAESVPRFLDLPAIRVVVPGASDVLNAGTYDTIDVGGTLTIPAVEVKVTHLFVQPGGTLIVECGATIVGRNVPIDTGRDPFQWGNGLLNFGTLIMKCPEKSPFMALTGSAANGASSLTLASDPIGWAVGDELMLPDTLQQIPTGKNGATTPRRETTTIASLNGRTVGLSKPLGFARNSITRPDGSVVLTPRVANLSRRTVIKSESPTGTRWHIAHVGGAASWDVQGVALVGLGRTRGEVLNSTPADRSHVGTNQVGRYGFHMHHVGSSLAVRRVDSSVVQGLNGQLAKWPGLVIHQSHDIVLTNNVGADGGALIITEDGNEVRNVITGNFAAYCGGSGDSRLNLIANNPMGESCYGIHGAGNIFDKNEAWNGHNGINLINLVNPAVVGVLVPSVKGGTQNTSPVQQNVTPISFKDNVAAANTQNGMEYWTLIAFPNERLISANNGNIDVLNGQADGPADVLLIDPIIVAQNGVGTGIFSSIGYTRSVETVRGEVRGCDLGVGGGIGLGYGKFTDTVFQCVTNFWSEQGWPPVTWNNVTFQPYGSGARQYIMLPPDTTQPWTGPPAPFPGERGAWDGHQGSTMVIHDWQGTGQNYRLVYPTQERSYRAWTASNESTDWTLPPPECGLTMGEVWDKCGMAYRGDTFAASDAVNLDGLVNLVAVPDPRPLGPPRAVLALPNIGQPTVANDPNGLFMQFILTGPTEAASRAAYFSVDGGPRMAATRDNRLDGKIYLYGWNPVTTTGTHTVRTWREQNGVEVPNSSLIFHYVIGAGGPPPPPPPTDPPVNCALSAISSTTSGWTLSGTTYTRTTTETRTVLTAPSNGGTPCQP